MLYEYAVAIWPVTGQGFQNTKSLDRLTFLNRHMIVYISWNLSIL